MTGAKHAHCAGRPPDPYTRVYDAAMRVAAIAVLLAACGPSAKEPEAPAEPAEPTPPPAPDAGPSAAVASAPAWVFAYRTADRSETWTLRHAGGEAMIDVETPKGTTRYLGSATDGDTLVLALSATTAKISLECKRTTRAIGTACNDTKAAPVDVLDCYHPDFETPMPFGAAPGIEYVIDATCNGYRLAAP
jgi:hypothetical protein